MMVFRANGTAYSTFPYFPICFYVIWLHSRIFCRLALHKMLCPVRAIPAEEDTNNMTSCISGFAH